MVSKQPENWQCVPWAFSYIIGIDMDLLMKTVGHDGSKIITPSAPEPLNRQAFTVQEMLIAIMQFGWVGCRLDSKIRTRYPCHELDKSYEFNLSHDGVIILEGHAVAWVNGKAWDCNGYYYSSDREIIAYIPLFRIPGLKIEV